MDTWAVQRPIEDTAMNDDEMVFATSDEVESSRREIECGWSELLAEATGWPVIDLDS